MNRETARQEIRARISCADYLEKSQNGMYCCPFCGSGTGPNKSGALKLYETNTFNCFSCGRSGDVIDLVEEKNGISYSEALSLLADQIGITIDRYQLAGGGHFGSFQKTARAEAPESAENGSGNIKTLPGSESQQNGPQAPQEAAADYSGYYQACRARLNDPDALNYLNGRGISRETAETYWIGYDPEWRSKTALAAGKNPPASPRIIIPSSRSHYVARDIRRNLPKEQRGYSKMNEGSPAIFNERALYAHDAHEVFVLEGAFDALSVIEAGAPAIALNSAGNAKKLVKQLEKRGTGATLILCPDNDPDPKTAERIKGEFATLGEALQRLNISYLTADINGNFKDANEHLTGDRQRFIEAVERARRRATAPDNTALYIDELMSAEIERFRADKKTGFSNLDKKAGGLYPGLYGLAATSSLGKTSFALQLADRLAWDGNDVLFFSLEQSRLELVSKSFARLLYIMGRNVPEAGLAITSLEIRKGTRPDLTQRAAAAYKEKIADRLSIIEGNFNCDVSFIGNYIRKYIDRTGRRPVVFVDYLQILQPSKENATQSTRELINSTVQDLKLLSRNLDITIFVISSVNRANYLTPIDFESLKESGGIEYTCDVIWGLQLRCLSEDPVFDKQNAIREKRNLIKEKMAEEPREIELVCLKNRYGLSKFSCYFDYFPAHDFFEPASDQNEQSIKKEKRIRSY